MAPTLSQAVEQLETAEAFFAFFNVDYEPGVIRHQRIHLLRLFQSLLPENTEQLEFADYQLALTKAYCLLKEGKTVDFATDGCGSCTQCNETLEDA